MNRRELLAGVSGAGIALVGGCLATDSPGGSDDGSTDTPSPEATPEPAPTDTPTATPRSAGGADITTTRTATPSGLLNVGSVEFVIHQRINRARSGRGYPDLELNSRLREVARYHSEDMARNRYVEHTSPDGETIADRYAEFGLDCSSRAENLAKTYYREEVDVAGGNDRYETPGELGRAIANRWLEFDSYRNNVMRREWTAHGIGVFAVERAGRIVVYATQNFC
jgi:uncharacterized protein YkwD